MTDPSFTAELKEHAKEIGFAAAGVCRAVEPPGVDRFRQWLAEGYAGQMHYLPDRSEAYSHPQHVLNGVRSILMLTMDYRTAEPSLPTLGEGRIARYAWGEVDYHDIVRERLNALAYFVVQKNPDALVRGVVDTAPLLERDFAQLAGIGWIGKNTLLLRRDAGSYFFLAALLTDLELDYDEPFAADHCGTCRACLDACPTDAFPKPYVLDATRCISYLTIELRDPIPTELREPMGDWLFGCDICQDVCPWNRFASAAVEDRFLPRPDQNPTSLLELFALDDATFRQMFRHTPLWRGKRRGLLRNAAIVLGNQRPPEAISPLAQGLHDSESLIRGASAWALGRYDTPAARSHLEQRLEIEEDAIVRREVIAALGEG